jgi:hypothetical protein
MGPATACRYGPIVEVIVILNIFLMDRLQELYALDKVGLSDGHDKIDGVKIFPTLKASGQIGLRIYRGVISAAQGAKKTKAPLCHPIGDVQRFFDERLNVDIISKGVKPAGGKAALGHWIYPEKVDTIKRKVSPSVFHIQKDIDTPV